MLSALNLRKVTATSQPTRQQWRATRLCCHPARAGVAAADGDEAYGAAVAVTPTARSTVHGLAEGARAGGTTHNNSGIAFMAGFVRSLLPR